MSIQSLCVVLGLSLSWVGLSACSSDSNPDSGGAGGSNIGGSALAAAGAASGPSAVGGAGSSAAGSESTANQPPGAAGASSAAAGYTSDGASSGGTTSVGGGAAGAATASCTGSAMYKITLDVSWSDSQVSGKHYTTLIGGVHSANVNLWKLGGMATAGVKSMAEAGGTMLLAGEVRAAISAGSAQSVIQFGGGNAPGKSSGAVEVSPSFPLISFGSMLAPSPDWFVGVSSLNLCDAGAWVPSVTLDAVVYDAGTKDGADFDYGFPETQPHAPIGYSPKFPGNVPAGTLRFEKQ